MKETVKRKEQWTEVTLQLQEVFAQRGNIMYMATVVYGILD
jgi:hypothetical protein